MNADKLKGKLVEKKATYEDCSNWLNITKTGFSNKINGKSDFTVDEAKILSIKLSLTNDEMCDIFLT